MTDRFARGVAAGYASNRYAHNTYDALPAADYAALNPQSSAASGSTSDGYGYVDPVTGAPLPPNPDAPASQFPQDTSGDGGGGFWNGLLDGASKVVSTVGGAINDVTFGTAGKAFDTFNYVVSLPYNGSVGSAGDAAYQEYVLGQGDGSINDVVDDINGAFQQVMTGVTGQLPGYIPGVDAPGQAFLDWAKANPDLVKQYYEEGWDADGDGQVDYTGGRAVWEGFANTQNMWQRIGQNIAGDPLTWAVPVGNGAAKGVRVLGEAADIPTLVRRAGAVEKAIRISDTIQDAPIVLPVKGAARVVRGTDRLLGSPVGRTAGAIRQSGPVRGLTDFVNDLRRRDPAAVARGLTGEVGMAEDRLNLQNAELAGRNPQAYVRGITASGSNAAEATAQELTQRGLADVETRPAIDLPTRQDALDYADALAESPDWDAFDAGVETLRQRGWTDVAELLEDQRAVLVDAEVVQPRMTRGMPATSAYDDREDLGRIFDDEEPEAMAIPEGADSEAVTVNGSRGQAEPAASTSVRPNAAEPEPVVLGPGAPDEETMQRLGHYAPARTRTGTYVDDLRVNQILPVLDQSPSKAKRFWSYYESELDPIRKREAAAGGRSTIGDVARGAVAMERAWVRVGLDPADMPAWHLRPINPNITDRTYLARRYAEVVAMAPDTETARNAYRWLDANGLGQLGEEMAALRRERQDLGTAIDTPRIVRPDAATAARTAIPDQKTPDVAVRDNANVAEPGPAPSSQQLNAEINAQATPGATTRSWEEIADSLLDSRTDELALPEPDPSARPDLAEDVEEQLNAQYDRQREDLRSSEQRPSSEEQERRIQALGGLGLTHATGNPSGVETRAVGATEALTERVSAMAPELRVFHEMFVKDMTDLLTAKTQAKKQRLSVKILGQVETANGRRYLRELLGGEGEAAPADLVAEFYNRYMTGRTAARAVVDTMTRDQPAPRIALPTENPPDPWESAGWGDDLTITEYAEGPDGEDLPMWGVSQDGMGLRRGGARNTPKMPPYEKWSPAMKQAYRDRRQARRDLQLANQEAGFVDEAERGRWDFARDEADEAWNEGREYAGSHNITVPQPSGTPWIEFIRQYSDEGRLNTSLQSTYRDFIGKGSMQDSGLWEAFLAEHPNLRPEYETFLKNRQPVRQYGVDSFAGLRQQLRLKANRQIEGRLRSLGRWANRSGRIAQGPRRAMPDTGIWHIDTRRELPQEELKFAKEMAKLLAKEGKGEAFEPFNLHGFLKLVEEIDDPTIRDRVRQVILQDPTRELDATAEQIRLLVMGGSGARPAVVSPDGPPLPRTELADRILKELEKGGSPLPKLSPAGRTTYRDLVQEYTRYRNGKAFRKLERRRLQLNVARSFREGTLFTDDELSVLRRAADAGDQKVRDLLDTNPEQLLTEMQKVRREIDLLKQKRPNPATAARIKKLRGRDAYLHKKFRTGIHQAFYLLHRDIGGQGYKLARDAFYEPYYHDVVLDDVDRMILDAARARRLDTEEWAEGLTPAEVDNQILMTQESIQRAIDEGRAPSAVDEEKLEILDRRRQMGEVPTPTTSLGEDLVEYAEDEANRVIVTYRDGLGADWEGLGIDLDDLRDADGKLVPQVGYRPLSTFEQQIIENWSPTWELPQDPKTRLEQRLRERRGTLGRMPSTYRLDVTRKGHTPDSLRRNRTKYPRRPGKPMTYDEYKAMVLADENFDDEELIEWTLSELARVQMVSEGTSTTAIRESLQGFHNTLQQRLKDYQMHTDLNEKRTVLASIEDLFQTEAGQRYALVYDHLHPSEASLKQVQSAGELEGKILDGTFDQVDDIEWAIEDLQDEGLVPGELSSHVPDSLGANERVSRSVVSRVLSTWVNGAFQNQERKVFSAAETISELESLPLAPEGPIRDFQQALDDDLFALDAATTPEEKARIRREITLKLANTTEGRTFEEWAFTDVDDRKRLRRERATAREVASTMAQTVDRILRSTPNDAEYHYRSLIEEARQDALIAKGGGEVPVRDYRNLDEDELFMLALAKEVFRARMDHRLPSTLFVHDLTDNVYKKNVSVYNALKTFLVKRGDPNLYYVHPMLAKIMRLESHDLATRELALELQGIRSDRLDAPAIISESDDALLNTRFERRLSAEDFSSKALSSKLATVEKQVEAWVDLMNKGEEFLTRKQKDYLTTIEERYRGYMDPGVFRDGRWVRNPSFDAQEFLANEYSNAGKTYHQVWTELTERTRKDMEDYVAERNAAASGRAVTPGEAEKRARFFALMDRIYGAYGGLAEQLPDGTWVPNVDFKQRSYVEMKFNEALRLELGIKQVETRMSRFLDRYDGAVSFWRNIKLINPLGFPIFYISNGLGNMVQLLAHGEINAAVQLWKNVPGSTAAMFSESHLTETASAKLLRQAGFGVTHHAISSGSLANQLSRNASAANDRVVAKSRNKLVRGWQRYKSGAHALAGGLELAARDTTYALHFSEGLIRRKRDLIEHADEYVKQQQWKRKLKGVNVQEVRQVIEGTDKIMSPMALRTALENYGKLRGLPEDEFNAFADRMARDWSEMQKLADRDALDKVNRSLFDFEYTKLDTYLHRIMPFHYWATRNLPAYITVGLTNPALAAAYFRMMEGLDSEELPTAVRDKLKVFQTDLGYGLFFSPLAMMGVVGILEQDLGTPPDGESAIGAMLRQLRDTTGMGLYPWFTSPLNLSGVMGDTTSGMDPTGFGRERRMFEQAVQWLASEGVIAPELQERPFEQMLMQGREYLTRLLPGETIEAGDANRGAKIELRVAIWEEIRERDGGDPDMPLNEDQLEEAEMALISPDSKLYQDALDRMVSNGWWTNVVGPVLVPGGLTGVQEQTLKLNERKQVVDGTGITALWRPDDPYADGAITPEEQAWMDAYRRKTGKEYHAGDLLDYKERTWLENELKTATPEHAKLLLAEREADRIGTPEARLVVDTYDKIRYGTIAKVSIGGTTYTADSLSSLTSDDRYKLANQWLADDETRRDQYTSVKDLKDAYVSANVIYRDYQNWREEIYGYPSVSAYRYEMVQKDPEIRAYFEAERQRLMEQNPGISMRDLVRRLDGVTTSLEFYEKLHGIRTSVYDPLIDTPDHDVDTTPRSREPLRPEDDTSYLNATPATDVSEAAGVDLTAAAQAVATFGQNYDQINQYASMMMGQTVNVATLPRATAEVLLQQIPAAIAGSNPVLALDYYLWASQRHQGGGDTSIEAFVSGR